MPYRIPALLLVLGASACSFLIDFDDLQTATGTGGSDAAGGRDAKGGSDASGGTVEPQAGTGPDNGGEGGARPGITLEEAPAALSKALCSTLEACVGRAAMSVIFADEDCNLSTESVLANTIVAAVQRSVDEGTLEYDAAGLPACIDAYADLGCEDVTVGFPEECKQALDGLQAEGETCAHALECEAGLYCGPNCACAKPVAEGEQCFVTAQCEAGLACFMGACAPLGGEGDPCGGGVAPDCLTGFICVTADEKAAMAGRCFTAEDLFLRREGEDCNTVGNPPVLCDEGLACPVALFPKCLPTAPSGGACQLSFPDMCPEGEYCSAGACTPLPGPGEACASGLVVKRPCSAYSRCVNGVCRTLGDNGNTCVVPEECWSAVCTEGRCAPPHCE